MVDTVRTIADILILLANNTTGDINPQDMRDAVVSLEALSHTTPISATIVNPGTVTGDFFLHGFYDAPVADSNLTNASTTQTHGAANSSHAAHAIVVAAAAGVTDGSDLVLTVTGTSITSAGVRTTGDSETIVADCTASSTDQYYETTKHWLGQVTYTLTSSGGGTFNYDFNYGFAAYDDISDSNFLLDHFVFEWYGKTADTNWDIHVVHHKSTGWTYHASAFVPGPPDLYSLTVDHSTDNKLIANDYGRWKRTGLSDSILGASNEGLIVHVTTSVNNSLNWCNSSIFVRPVP
jgi:hypothetical protein